MARFNLNVSDDLQQKVRDYCDLNDITVTTFYHMAVSHYLNHLELSKDLEGLFKSFMDKQLRARD